MTDPDMQELTALWQEPSPAEQRSFEEAARKARRQGKLLAWADVALAALLGGTFILGLVLTPGPITGALALLMIAITTYVMIKRRRLRQMSPTLKTTSRQAFLDSSVKMAVANVRRITLSLYLIPLSIALGASFKVAMRNGGTIDRPLERFADWLPSWRGVLTITLGLLFIAWTYRSLRRARRELKRLEELRAAYDNEAADAGEHNENR